MKQFKITYQYQDFRTVQTHYAFVTAADADSAKAKFIENWANPSPVEIIKVMAVGV